MREARIPLVFWVYCDERRSLIHNMTENNIFQLQGHNPHFRRNLRKIRPNKWSMESELQKRSEFDTTVKKNYSDSFTIPPLDTIPNPQDDDGTLDPVFGEKAPSISEGNVIDANATHLLPMSLADTLVKAEGMLPQGEGTRLV